jgi:hypothetical protein
MFTMRAFEYIYIPIIREAVPDKAVDLREA